MTLGPHRIVEYALEVQRVELPRDRAEIVAGELARLVAGGLGAAALVSVADDPADFLAALWALRDRSE